MAKKIRLKNQTGPRIDDKDFYDSIQGAIDKKEHIDYFRGIIDEYEDYKTVMRAAFVQNQKAYFDVFTFRVDYILKKPVWREFEVEGCQTFEEFADAIIASMGWGNDHLHAFYLPEKRKGRNYVYAHSPYCIESPGFDEDPHPTYKTNCIRIADLDYDKNPKLGFVFDFGDGHRFDIRYLGTRKSTKKDKYVLFPQLVDQRGVAPDQYPEYYENNQGEIIDIAGDNDIDILKTS
jgi:hypothetical protein